MDCEYSDLEKINSSKDLALIIKKNFLVIIKISASWCGPCKNKKFLESYHNLKTTYKQIDKIKFIELDIDNNNDVLNDTKYYNIEIGAVPTFLISKNGIFTKKYEGSGHIDKISEYINDVYKSTE